jgi:two-component system, cell cycle response regulator DivK
MGKRLILVIEDNPDNLTLILDMLESLNYAVISAGNGQKGIELAAAQKPDVILMDLALPVMDGWSAAQHIKSNPELQHIPIIALSAHALAGDRERALESGCNDYLPKPINLTELTDLLTKYMD